MSKHLYRPVGVEVRYARKRRGMTQKELSQSLIGVVTHGSISHIERGDRIPMLGTLIKIAEATNMQLRITFTPVEEIDETS